MRKQYHFRESKRGLLAWDVDRLVAAAQDVPVTSVALEEIQEIDEPYWFGHETPTCRRVLEHMKLVDACDLTYPILLCADGRIMDGMHRVLKALAAGNATIEARRFTTTPEPDHVGRRPDELNYGSGSS